jgi:GH15 family glucan-1,4-alpha-glucosidase
VSGTNSSAFRQVESGILQKQTAAVGDCDSAFEFARNPTPEGKEIDPVTVFIAFGKTYGEAIETLDYARQSGYDTLLEEATRRHADNLHPTQNANNSSDRWLDVLLTCMDRETGALVRMPLASPPMHVDIPRHGVMGAYALSVAGRHERVRKRIDFYLNALRTESSPGRPAGSIPAALYTNGEEAAPHAILDVEAVGWVLWLCHHHAENLDPPQRSAFIETSWPKIELAAEFLTSWADPRTGLPRTAFNPQTLRDDQSPGLAIHAFMGLESALALATLKGQERPEWRKRMQELENVIRARYIDSDGFWRVPRPELYWNISLVPDTHPRWEPTLGNLVASLYATKPSPDVTSEIVFAATLIPGAGNTVKGKTVQLLETGMLEELLMPPALALNSRVPDSYMAALQYIVWEKSQVRLPETPAIFQVPSAGWAPQPP